MFIQLLGTIAPVDSEASLRVVLYRIAGQLVIEHPGRQPLYSEPPSELRQVIRRLPADQQQVLILKLAEDLSNNQIAQILGRTEDAVKELQHRALVALSRLRTNQPGYGGMTCWPGSTVPKASRGPRNTRPTCVYWPHWCRRTPIDQET